jgi:SAM-dependent methyltransferase
MTDTEPRGGGTGAGDGTDADAFNRFEAAGWERSAAPYDAFFAGITSRLAGPVLDAVAAGDGTRLLDVATGPGYVAGAAAARGARVAAVDVSAAMVELAARAHPEVDVRPGDAEALPFADAAFDAVVCNFGVLHLGRPERAAAEAARVTAPGGRIALTVWDVPAKARLIGVFVDAMAAAGAAPPADLPVGPPFFRFSDEAEFAALLTGAGYGDVVVATVAFLHPVPSAEALWTGLLGGTVRTGPSILGQPAEVRQAIRSAFDRLVAEYAAPDGALAIPVSVKLASGRKPT